MIGTTVGKYRILDRLGRGGMGIVYKALDETLDREVAIKVLNPDVTDSELMKRFRAEAVSLARLNHPGIATIYELHRQGDDLLMVMEYVRGQTLQTLSEELGPFDPPHAAHICIQILDALAHAHRAGIVHRDLKPANVMMTESGAVKIMDFGIARMLGGESMTHAGYMMGTPAYMAPEQVLGQDIDGRADLYSVGVLFYRLLSRELPFQAETAIAMAQKQVADEPTPIRTFRPNLPPWCDTIIGQALAKAPADRFPSAEAFRTAIRLSVTPESFGELPTIATPTPAALRRASEASGASGPADVPTMTGLLPDVAGGTPPKEAAPAASSGAKTSPPTPATERTGTTVVLTRGHLVSLAGVIVLLIGGIAALGYMAYWRGGLQPQQTAESQPTDPASAASPDPSVSQPSGDQRPEPPPAPAPPTDGPAVSPPGAGQTRVGGAMPPAVPTAGDAALRKGKPDPKTSVAAGDPASGPSANGATGKADAGALPPVVLKDVRALVSQGNTMREREVTMTLASDALTLKNRNDDSELLALPYASIVQTFYSRSKQPKWRGTDGKEVTVPVDLGRLSFFRGDRNWVIFTTSAEPVFVRFEDADLRDALVAVQERTGQTIRR